MEMSCTDVQRKTLGMGLEVNDRWLTTWLQNRRKVDSSQSFILLWVRAIKWLLKELCVGMLQNLLKVVRDYKEKKNGKPRDETLELPGDTNEIRTESLWGVLKEPLHVL